MDEARAWNGKRNLEVSNRGLYCRVGEMTEGTDDVLGLALAVVRGMQAGLAR